MWYVHNIPLVLIPLGNTGGKYFSKAAPFSVDSRSTHLHIFPNALLNSSEECLEARFVLPVEQAEVSAPVHARSQEDFLPLPSPAFLECFQGHFFSVCTCPVIKIVLPLNQVKPTCLLELLTSKAWNTINVSAYS